MLIEVKQIHLTEPFTDIFPVDNKTLQSIRENMELNGYDDAEPLIVWKRNNKLTCVDGHTRYMAAQSLNLVEIPVIEKTFHDDDEAIDYAIHRQRDRRNLTDAELFKFIEWKDKRKDKEANLKQNITEAPDGASVQTGKKSAEQTAETLGISARKVERARTVMDHGDEETKQAIEKGEMSINKAYQETQKKRSCKSKDKWPKCSKCRYGKVRIKHGEPHPDHLCSSCYKAKKSEETLTKKQAELDAMPIDRDSEIYWHETLDILTERFNGCPVGKITQDLYGRLYDESRNLDSILRCLRKQHDARYL